MLFPTHVGVYPYFARSRSAYSAFSHTRGSVPLTGCRKAGSRGFFPHTWECTAPWIWFCPGRILFPTHVGVYLFRGVIVQEVRTFSHTRGSVPTKVKNSIRRPAFFPHTWEWSLLSDFPVKAGLLFPTQVGVIRFPIQTGFFQWTFSHASGSDPDNAIFFADGGSFFHMRGSSRHKLSKKSLYNIFLLKFFFHTYGRET